MIYETKINGGKFGDCLFIPHRDNSIKDYSDTIAKTDEELAHTFVTSMEIGRAHV